MTMDFSKVAILNVVLNFGSGDVPVGRLATKNGRIYFEYDPAFLESGLNISPFKLPLKGGLIRNEDTTFDGLFGVFNDSLPDGWGKLLTDRALRASGIPHESLSPLDRLSFVAGNGMGALKYHPEQFFGPSSYRTVNLDRVAADVNAVLQGSATDVIAELQAFGGSSAGARPKILVGYREADGHIISGTDDLPPDHGHWLIKFPSSSDPEDIAQMEQAYAIMARMAGVEMNRTRLFPGSEGKAYFGTERFDRTGGKRLHMHTAAGLLHSSHRFPSLDYSDLMHLAQQLTHDHREVLKVFRLCCFNVLAHNRDDHSKNFSFLMDGQGNWSFAPAYDLTFSFGPGGHQSTMVLGKGNAPDRKHLVKLAGEFSIKKPERIIDEVETAIRKWPHIAKETGVTAESAKMVSAYLFI
jgi:serine/threonine-protein kinase HipA